MPTDNGASAILSPDGTTLAFAAQPAGQTETRLFVRRLDQLQATALAGTEGAASPFFSPDGQWLAFVGGRKLKKVSVTGGAVVILADAANIRGGTWADDDTIFFQPANLTGSRFARVSAAGGTTAVFGTSSTGRTTRRWPQALPGGKSMLYTESSVDERFDAADLVVAPLSAGPPKVVVRSGYYGRYVPSGHVIYMQQGTLFAVRFGLDRLETIGQAVPAIEGIVADPVNSGGAQLAVSSEGTLVYVPGAAATAPTYPIEWATRDGKTSALRAAKANWANPRFSPDGQKLAIDIFDGKQYDIFVYEWARDTLTQLTFDPGSDRWPVWSPDGRHIVFGSDRAKPGVPNLYWVNADGTGEVTRLTDSPDSNLAVSFHPSGKFITFTDSRGGTQQDAMILPMEGDSVKGWTPGKPFVFLGTPAGEYYAIFSPDGRWIAYGSNIGGGIEVYVRPFPGPGGPWRVSTAGGNGPDWSATSPELLYMAQDTVMVARYSVAADSFRVETPQVWGPARLNPRGNSRRFAIHPDGKRLAFTQDVDENRAVQDKVVFFVNFADYLRKIAPGTK